MRNTARRAGVALLKGLLWGLGGAYITFGLTFFFLWMVFLHQMDMANAFEERYLFESIIVFIAAPVAGFLVGSIMMGKYAWEDQFKSLADPKAWVSLEKSGLFSFSTAKKQIY